MIVISSAQGQPPTKARIDNVVDDYFGAKAADPYRWMEDLRSEEIQDRMKAQAVYTDSYLQKSRKREEILKRLGELSSAGVRVGGI